MMHSSGIIRLIVYQSILKAQVGFKDMFGLGRYRCEESRKVMNRGALFLFLNKALSKAVKYIPKTFQC